MSSLTGRQQRLCSLCRENLFSRGAWRHFWQATQAAETALEHVVTRTMLLQSVAEGCVLCKHISAKVPGIMTVEEIKMTVEYTKPSSVRPPKLNQLVLTVQSPSGSVGKVLYLGVTAEPENIASAFIRAPFEHKNAAQNFDSRSALSWIRECRSKHLECSHQNLYKLPKRVLDISCGSANTIRLHVTDGSEGQEYAALSYCWGKSAPFCTLSSSLAEHQEGIQISRMPKTLQDAVRVAQDLGIKYIWIDALCILQDCADDKIGELSNMRLYYRNALLVIAATGARDVAEGFLKAPEWSRHSSTASAIPGLLDTLSIDAPFYDFLGTRGDMMIDLEPQTYEADTQPLNQRAWTLQERLLCARVLGFPSTGGFFLQCEREERHADTIHYGSQAGSERIYPSSSWSTELTTVDMNSPHEAWLQHARDYSQRGLSEPVDKYNAIAGVAEAYHLKYQIELGDYVAGHWREYLLKSLHWQNYELQPRNAPNIRRPPSWSWLSVDGNIIFLTPAILQQNYIALVEIQFVGIKTLFEKLPFGPVEIGCLSLRGRMGRGFWSPHHNRRSSPSLESEDGSFKDGVWTFADTFENFPKQKTPVYILPLCLAGIRPRLFGLLLRRLVPAYDGLYSRVGCFQGMSQEFMARCTPPSLFAII